MHGRTGLVGCSKQVARFARATLLVAIAVWPFSFTARTGGMPLVLQGKIPLGAVNGRLDHLGIDVSRRQLFVAELGNDSLGVIDLATGMVLRTISGFSEPQGVAYVAFANSVYVTNGGDGSVRVLRGGDLAPLGGIELGADADNIRVDDIHQRVLVGYGNGALAVIDPATRKRDAEIRLAGHPEGFGLETGARVFVNVPAAREIAVANLASGTVRSLANGGAEANFPMAIDRDAHRVIVAFRNPPALMALSSADGHVVARVSTCGDADDVSVDAARQRVYVSCGVGAIDVFTTDGGSYGLLARVPTATGARTSLFVPELDRLYVAVRSRSSAPAAIWVFGPAQ